MNIGSGQEISIANLSLEMAQAVGYQGVLTFNPDYPDGTPRKILDNTHINGMGWQPRVALADGLRETYTWLCQHPELACRSAA